MTILRLWLLCWLVTLAVALLYVCSTHGDTSLSGVLALMLGAMWGSAVATLVTWRVMRGRTA